MTAKEVTKILAIIATTYPNFKVGDMSQTIEAWTWALEEYSYETISIALKTYIATSNSGFAPSVSELIGMTRKPQELNSISEGEAWALVKKAIQNGNYGAEEEFNKLPPIVQKAVGSAGMIHQWAGTDSDEVNTVIASNFQRDFRTISKREAEKESLPPSLKALVNKERTLIEG